MPLLHLTDAEYAEHLLRLRSGQVKNPTECPLWQSLEWKRYQETLGRETRLYGLGSGVGTPPSGVGALRCSALVIIDRTSFGLSTWDIPRGPLGTSPVGAQHAVPLLLEGIVAEAGKERCMALYFSPVRGFPNYKLQTCAERCRSITNYKLQISERREQPEATLVLDLTLSDEELLKQMKPKGRYNIRLAQKYSVEVMESRDIDAFYALLKRTAKRDGFTIEPKEHYEKFLETLPGSFLLLAWAPPLAPHRSERSEDLVLGWGAPTDVRRIPAPTDARRVPLAALLGVTHNNTGYYYYGASDYAHRSLMAPYALQWEAMQLCRRRGCTTYDLLGIGPHWPGVTRFKEQFGGTPRRYPSEQEIVLRPVAKTLIGWKRKWHIFWHGVARACLPAGRHPAREVMRALRPALMRPGTAARPHGRDAHATPCQHFFPTKKDPLDWGSF